MNNIKIYRKEKQGLAAYALSLVLFLALCMPGYGQFEDFRMSGNDTITIPPKLPKKYIPKKFREEDQSEPGIVPKFLTDAIKRKIRETIPDSIAMEWDFAPGEIIISNGDTLFTVEHIMTNNYMRTEINSFIVIRLEGKYQAFHVNHYEKSKYIGSIDRSWEHAEKTWVIPHNGNRKIELLVWRAINSSSGFDEMVTDELSRLWIQEGAMGEEESFDEKLVRKNLGIGSSRSTGIPTIWFQQKTTNPAKDGGSVVPTGQ